MTRAEAVAMSRAMSRGCRHVLAALALLLPVAAAATPAGQVIFATGQVTAERNPPVDLAKGDEVLVADTVRTGARSRAQLRMQDGAMIAIRPDSALRIDEFMQAAGKDDPAVTAASGGRSVTSLLKGGFRTITGAIGKEEDDTYEVRTPVGVLGIRGTEYAAVFCNGDCRSTPGTASPPPEDGLYVGVTAGIVYFRNEIGDIELRAGEYAFIPLSTRRPQRLDVPPPVLMERGSRGGPQPAGSPPISGFDSKLGSRRRPDIDAGPADDTGSAAPTPDDPPAQPVIVIDDDGTPFDITSGESPERDPQTPPPGNRTISWTTGPMQGLQIPAYSGVGDNTPSQYALDTANDISGFNAPFPTTRQDSEPAQFDIGSASNAESGSDSVTLLRWGRWSEGTAGVVLQSGSTADQDLTQQSLHWISSPDWLTPAAIPVTGTATYSLIGATAPTDNFGNTGLLGDASLVADFTNQQVTSTLSIEINQSQWQATGGGALGPLLDPARAAHLFEGLYDVVSIDGVSGGSGVFSGFFSSAGDSSDPAFPGGAGLTYTLHDPNGQTAVSGAAAFGNP